jgi:hypothetical protein
MSNTELSYQQIMNSCESVFVAKTKDYGTSWRVLRPISIVDQLYIKAQRIRTIQDTGVQKVNEDIQGEWKAIINYGIIALMQMDLIDNDDWDVPVHEAHELYHKHFRETYELMLQKNHDYGEAWRNMSQESLADLILTKVLRIKQIIANNGKTVVSEGIDANYRDIINYAVFALILADSN